MTDQPQTPPMTPSQPYLLRAMNQWIADNGMTPQILVNGAHPDLILPDSVRNQDKVVLNISQQAVRDLLIDNEYLSFVARFSGVSHGVTIPIAAIQAIYARENGQGMMFPEPDPDGTDPDAKTSDDGDGDSARAAGKPDLRVVK